MVQQTSSMSGFRNLTVEERLALLVQQGDLNDQDVQLLLASQEAVRVAVEVGDRYQRVWGLAALGYALIELARLEEASEALRKALELRQHFTQHHATMNCAESNPRVSSARAVEATPSRQCSTRTVPGS